MLPWCAFEDAGLPHNRLHICANRWQLQAAKLDMQNARKGACTHLAMAASSCSIACYVSANLVTDAPANAADRQYKSS